MSDDLDAISSRILHSNGGNSYNININSALGGNSALDSLITSDLLPFPSIHPIEHDQKSFYSDPMFKQDAQALSKISDHSLLLGAISSMISNTDVSYL